MIGDDIMSEVHFIPDEVAPLPRRRFRVRTLVVVVLIVGGLVGVLGRAMRQAKEAARASQCICNLCMIKMALLNYHEANGSFPPAYVADATGRPMHSWRVLILPFMEQPALYNAYNMAEPWDGPNNRKLLEQRPNVYNCPSRVGEPTLTSYVAITGPGTAFPGSKATKLGDIHDGPGQTILVSEISNVDIAWSEPRDLDVKTMSWVIDDPSKPSISSPHESGPAVVFADATYRRLKTYHPPEALKAMTTIDGGEPVDMEKPH
jgi:Protein of unknown function (DUF1559)